MSRLLPNNYQEASQGLRPCDASHVKRWASQAQRLT